MTSSKYEENFAHLSEVSSKSVHSNPEKCRQHKILRSQPMCISQPLETFLSILF